MRVERTWDICDESEAVVVKKAESRPIRRLGIPSSAVQVVFGVLTIITPSTATDRPMAFISKPEAIVETLIVPRADVPGRQAHESQAQATDARVGLSTGRLADLFPVLFEPVTEENSEEAPFFLS